MLFFPLFLVAACLPEGEHGIGQALVAERGLSGLQLTDGRPGLPAGALYTRRVLNTTLLPVDEGRTWFELPTDLFFLPSGGSPRRLLQDYQTSARWDAAQRLYVLRDSQVSGGGPVTPFEVTAELWRVHLDGMPSLSLGRVRSFDLSPGRTRLLYQPERERWVLVDLEDHQVGFATRDHPRFVGEDLFFVQDGTLFRVHDPAAGPMPVLSGEGIAFFTVGSGDGHLMVVAASRGTDPRLLRLRADADDPPELIDLPGQVSGPILSPEGSRMAWLQRLDRERGQLHVLDLDTRQETRGELPLPPPEMRPPPSGVRDPDAATVVEPSAELEFRPGTSELWCFLDRQLSILRLDGQVLTGPLASTGFRVVPHFARGGFIEDQLSGFFPGSEGVHDPGSRFSRDGRWWTVPRDSGGDLGDADHPESDDTVPIFGDDDEVDPTLTEVVPGRWVAFWRGDGFDQRELWLLDVTRRTSRVLARNVASARLGGTRAIVRASSSTPLNSSPGDLSLVDLETGSQTPLARNVVDFALAPACPDCDPTGPGAHLVYVVHARVPWRYDGLWDAVLP